MSRKVKGPDGTTHIFPDDATDEEIQTALGGAEPPVAKPAPSQPKGETDAHGNTITRNPDGSVKTIVGPGYRGTTEHRPDSNLLTIGGVGIAPEDILMAPSLAKGALSLVAPTGRGIAATGRGIEAIATSKPVKRMSELGAVGEALMHGNLGRAAGAYIAPKAAAMAGRGMQKVGGAMARVGQAAPAAAEVAEEVAPVAAKAAAKAFNPNDALKVAREAFAKAGVEPLPAEVSNTFELIRRGKAPEEALQVVLKNRPGGASGIPSAVAKIAKENFTAEEVAFGKQLMDRGKTMDEAIGAIRAQRALKSIPGMESNAQRIAVQDKRWAQGKVKTPSAETARRNR
jgi:hypothetical protein